MRRLLAVFCVSLALCCTAEAQGVKGVDWRRCQLNNNSDPEVAAATRRLQERLRNVGCLTLEDKAVQRRENVDGIWGPESSGLHTPLDHATLTTEEWCQRHDGKPPDKTRGFNGFLAFTAQAQSFKTNFKNWDLTRVEKIFDGYRAGDDFCKPRKSKDKPVLAGKCNFPAAGNAWLEKLKLSSASKESQTLGSALRHLETVVNDYGSYIPPVHDLGVPWLGETKITSINTARADMLLKIRALLRIKDELAIYGAIATNPVCVRCVLLADFDVLVSLTGPPTDGRRIIADTDIDIDRIDFETIRNAHKDLQDLGKKYRDYVLKFQKISRSTSNEGLRDAAAAKQEFDSAKQKVVTFLKANKPQTEDWFFQFADKRRDFCGSGVKIPDSEP